MFRRSPMRILASWTVLIVVLVFPAVGALAQTPWQQPPPPDDHRSGQQREHVGASREQSAAVLDAPGLMQDDQAVSESASTRVSTSDVIRRAVEANADSRNPCISADGRFIVFESDASNLVPHDGNNASDIFVHDRATHQTARVSIAWDGAETNGPSHNPAISADGRYVAFDSSATNLVPAVSGAHSRVFVYDRLTGTVVRIRVRLGPSAIFLDVPSTQPSMSASGRYLTFFTRLARLLDRPLPIAHGISLREMYGNTARALEKLETENGIPSAYVLNFPGHPLIYLHDRDTDDDAVFDETEAQRGLWLNPKLVGSPNDRFGPVISSDGSYVAFAGYPGDWPTEGAEGTGDVRVHHLETGQTRSVGSHFWKRNSEFLLFPDQPTWSRNGTCVSFGLLTRMRFDLGRNWACTLCVYNAESDSLSQIPLHSCEGVALSEGRFAAFSSVGRLDPADTEDRWRDVFVVGVDSSGRNIQGEAMSRGAFHWISRPCSGNEPNGNSVRPSISADGRIVAFQSTASNLVVDDTNEKEDIFVHDRGTGRTTCVSITSRPEGRGGETPELSKSDFGALAWTEMTKLSPYVPHFGDSVSISGGIAAIGAPFQDTSGGKGAGAAYLFVRNGAPWARGWSQGAILTARDGQTGDHFGHAVSVTVNTAVIGAWWDDDAGQDCGSVYVFVRANSTSETWAQQGKLTASEVVEHGKFGSSVSIDRDTIVVGVPGDTPPGKKAGSVFIRRQGEQEGFIGMPRAGSAYVFIRSGSTWSKQSKLTASDAAPLDSFGSSVSLSGDTVVVGAPGADGATGQNAGSAYVFVRNGAAWREQTKLVARDANGGDTFGSSVSISGDILVVGAPMADSAGRANAGAGYVFARTGSDWEQQTRLAPPEPAHAVLFGSSVSVSGNTIVVGAPGYRSEGERRAGSVYVFSRCGSGWFEQTKLVASDPAASDSFGHVVSVSGEHIVVGARFGALPRRANAGAAYVFTRSAENSNK